MPRHEVFGIAQSLLRHRDDSTFRRRSVGDDASVAAFGDCLQVSLVDVDGSREDDEVALVRQDLAEALAGIGQRLVDEALLKREQACALIDIDANYPHVWPSFAQCAGNRAADKPHADYDDSAEQAIPFVATAIMALFYHAPRASGSAYLAD